MANVPGAENGEAAETADPFANQEWSPSEVAYNGKIINVHLGDGQRRTGRHSRADVQGLPRRLRHWRSPAVRPHSRLAPTRWARTTSSACLPGLLTGTPIFGNRFQVVCKSAVDRRLGRRQLRRRLWPLPEVRRLGRHPLLRSVGQPRLHPDRRRRRHD